MTVVKLADIFAPSQEKIARIFVKDSLKLPLTKYKLDMGSYPTEEDGGLMALLSEPKVNSGKWMGPYIEELPDDPWRNPYLYKFPGVKNPKSYDLWSTGPNLNDPSDDIGNWKEEGN